MTADVTAPDSFVSQRPPVAWLFDIDGVLTDPELKVIRRPEILRELAKRLARGEPVGGNTGRSLSFAAERFLDPLAANVGSPELLAHVVVIGDKGGAWLVHDETGRRRFSVDDALMTEPLRALANDVRQLVRRDYAHVVFVDETKQTMVTIEMNDGLRVGTFHAVREELTGKLQELVMRRGLQDQLRVDATRIAIDVEHRHAGKALGARRYVELLEGQGVEPRHYIAFGDSPSDFDMAAELYRMGRSVEFVFVGGEGHLKREEIPIPVTFTRGLCDGGTLEYLEQAPPVGR